MPVTQDAVFEKLKNVIDPELFVNVVDLGLIYEIKVNEPREADGQSKSDVHIDMTMTSPACPAGPQLIGGAKQQVGALEGVGDVEVKIVLDPPGHPTA